MPPNSAPSSNNDRFGRANWLLIAAGVVLLIAGFGVLALADERAANLAGRLSPFLILAAYAMIFIALIYRPRK
jgi:amino acid transporter